MYLPFLNRLRQLKPNDLLADSLLFVHLTTPYKMNEFPEFDGKTFRKCEILVFKWAFYFAI
jgi:hypothetical protein